MTYHDAIRRIFDADPRPRGSEEVVAALRARWPEVGWHLSTVRTILNALCLRPVFAPRVAAPLSKLRATRVPAAGSARGLPARCVRHEDGAPVPSAGSGSAATSEAETAAAARRTRTRRAAPTVMHAGGQRVTAGPVPSPTPRDARCASVRRDLIRALVEHIETEPFQAQYRRRPVGPVVCGWAERLERYFWPTPADGLSATLRTMTPWFERAGVPAAAARAPQHHSRRTHACAGRTATAAGGQRTRGLRSCARSVTCSTSRATRACLLGPARHGSGRFAVSNACCSWTATEPAAAFKETPQHEHWLGWLDDCAGPGASTKMQAAGCIRRLAPWESVARALPERRRGRWFRRTRGAAGVG